MPRYFTPARASDALVEIRPLVEQLIEHRRAQERIGVARCVNAIHEQGAIVKSPDEGLIDFPAQREGEEILLCWRLGEDEVAFWHPLEEGFAGRKPIDPE